MQIPAILPDVMWPQRRFRICSPEHRGDQEAIGGAATTGNTHTFLYTHTHRHTRDTLQYSCTYVRESVFPALPLWGCDSTAHFTRIRLCSSSSGSSKVVIVIEGIVVVVVVVARCGCVTPYVRIRCQEGYQHHDILQMKLVIECESRTPSPTIASHRRQRRTRTLQDSFTSLTSDTVHTSDEPRQEGSLREIQRILPQRRKWNPDLEGPKDFQDSKSIRDPYALS